MLESLRNGFGELVRHVGPWIAKRLIFKDWHTPFVAELWTTLELDQDVVELLVALQLRWEDGHLACAKAYEACDDVVQQVTMCLLRCWRFKKFSDSRWVSIGTSCRCMLSALALGLADLVEFVLASDTASTYFISGFKYLDKDVKRLLGVVGMSSFLSDSLLSQLLEDDRVLRTLPSLESDIRAKLCDINDIAEGVFEVVGEFTDFTGSSLRNACISSCFTQASYIFARLRRARQPPFDLMLGDIEDNLERLQRRDAPEDEVSYQIWCLLREGCARSDVVAALTTTSHASWSATVVEQGHVHASMTMRRHKQYTQRSMRARAAVAQFKVLLDTVLAERKLVALRRHLDCLARKRPQHFTGRQLFVRCLNDHEQRKLVARPADKRAVSKKIIKGHGQAWRALPPLARRAYELEADCQQDRSRGELQQKKDSLLAEIELQTQRVRATRAVGAAPIMRLGQCRLRDSEIADFNAFFASPQWTAMHVEARLARADQATGPLSHGFKQALGDVDSSSEDETARLGWVKLIAYNRDVFGDCVFWFLGAPPSCAYYVLCYALQNPLFLGVCRVEPCHEPMPHITPARHTRLAWSSWSHRFTLTHEFHYSDEPCLQNVVEIRVLQDAARVGHGVVVSDSEWVSLGDLRASLREVEVARPGARKSRRDARAAAAPFHDHPWLLDYLDDPSMRDGAASGRSAHEAIEKGGALLKDGSDASGSDEEVAMWSDEHVLALYAKRHELSSAADRDTPDFSWELRGGKWTLERKGVVYDCVAAKARAQDVADWCVAWSLPQSSSWSTLLYGEGPSVQLATAWCSRMQHYYDVHVERGFSRDFVFNEEHSLSWPCPDSLAALDASSRADMRRRVAQIRNLAPTPR